MIVETKEEFLKLVATDNVVLVMFHSTWCPPCRMLKPIVLEFEENNPQYQVLFVNTDEIKNINKEYNVYEVPSLCWFRNGSIVETLEGYVSYEEIEEVFEHFQ